MRRRTLRLTVPLALLAIALPGALTARSLGSLEFSPCSLSTEGIPAAVEAQCTTLSVPEDRSQQGGRRIELAIAWVPARDEALPDPVFMLAGGPGQSARDSYPQIAPAFADTNKRRHVILVDQRGTGGSHPLSCADLPDAEAALGSEGFSAERTRAFAQHCRDKLAADADLGHYTTTDAIADLDAVRAAIGAAQINLVGISYGTRVAQQYAARYPVNTRSVVLDSPVPNSLYLGQDHAANLETALAAQFARCGEDSACGKALGDPQAHLRALIDRVQIKPLIVRYRDPVDAEWREDPLDLDRLVTVVRLFAYSPLTAALLPLSLKEAIDGQPETLMAQSRMILAQLEGQMMHGMELSVLCSEDVSGLHLDPADADRLLGTAFIESIKAQCAVWPKGEMPADFHHDFAGEMPTLVLSGELDPVTPPRYAEEIVAHLGNGRLLTLRGQGHNVIPAGCMPKLMARFIASADAKSLDATCLDTLDAPPPFSGPFGWEP